MGSDSENDGRKAAALPFGVAQGKKAAALHWNLPGRKRRVATGSGRKMRVWEPPLAYDGECNASKLELQRLPDTNRRVRGTIRTAKAADAEGAKAGRVWGPELAEDASAKDDCMLREEQRSGRRFAPPLYVGARSLHSG
jgi:hypothetical protein